MAERAYGEPGWCPVCRRRTDADRELEEVVDGRVVEVRVTCRECGSVFHEVFSYHHSEYRGESAWG